MNQATKALTVLVVGANELVIASSDGITQRIAHEHISSESLDFVDALYLEKNLDECEISRTGKRQINLLIEQLPLFVRDFERHPDGLIVKGTTIFLTAYDRVLTAYADAAVNIAQAITVTFSGERQNALEAIYSDLESDGTTEGQMIGDHRIHAIQLAMADRVHMAEKQQSLSRATSKHIYINRRTLLTALVNDLRQSARHGLEPMLLEYGGAIGHHAISVCGLAKYYSTDIPAHSRENPRWLYPRTGFIEFDKTEACAALEFDIFLFDSVLSQLGHAERREILERCKIFSRPQTHFIIFEPLNFRTPQNMPKRTLYDDLSLTYGVAPEMQSFTPLHHKPRDYFPSESVTCLSVNR
jgi:hypothetical protein